MSSLSFVQDAADAFGEYGTQPAHFLAQTLNLIGGTVHHEVCAGIAP
jgi:hypothetical protein